MRARLAVLSLSLALIAPAAGHAEVIPEAVPDLPVLGAQAHRGNDLVVWPVAPVAPTPKTVDGQIDDWTGGSSRFGGTSILSRGELVYQDYLMDDAGADDGFDAERLATLDPLTELEPRAYRIDALQQAAGAQFGADRPIGAGLHYGDADPGALADQADIEEVRVAADDDTLFVLVRTTGMTTANGTAALVLIDTDAGGEWTHAGGVTTGAEHEVLAIGNTVTLTTNGTPAACACQAATNPADYVNAIEISIPLDALGLTNDAFSIAVATGVSTDGATIAPVKTGDAVSDLINVAFRRDEPARIWMDHDQALALRLGRIDDFFATVELDKLRTGHTQAFHPRPGYYERVFETDSPVNREATSSQYWQGSFQHYGIYFPSSYRPDNPTPATWWTHYRGGHAHDAAAWVPGLIRQLGEDRGNIVISPGARGTSTWYVGRGHEDFLDVWDDSMASFPIDPNRVYMSGYSMGGYASYLLPLLYPDRFAAAFPTAGPPTHGLWTGVDQITATDDDDARPEAQLMFDVIGNAANVGYVIYHGSNDELVPLPGTARMASELSLRGYPNRLYVFPGAEHYTNAIYDEWTEAAHYLDTFVRDPSPPRVVYGVKPSLEKAVEEVKTPNGTTLDYTFDGAYWIDGLVPRNKDADDTTNVGTIDVTSYGRGVSESIGVPEGGTGGQLAPHVWTGLRRIRTGFIEPANLLTGTLTNIEDASIELDGAGLSSTQQLILTLTTDGPATVRLVGAWDGPPANVLGAEQSMDSGALVLQIAGAGTHRIVVTP